MPWLFDWKELTGPANADLNRTFDVALHIGTFVGAAAYFRSDLLRLGRAGLRSLRRRSAETTDERLAWLLLVSSFPGAVIGALLEATIGDALTQIWLIAVLLIVFGLVLLAADRAGGERAEDDFRLRDAVIMGWPSRSPSPPACPARASPSPPGAGWGSTGTPPPGCRS